MFFHKLPQTQRVGDAIVEYLRAGEGPPLLYLHGCDGVDIADPFLKCISNNFDVIAPSLPGFGASDLPEWITSPGDIAEFLHRFVELLGLQECVVLGSSFGGWVAAELALRRSPRYSSLVLAAPLGARFSVDPQEREIRDIFTVPTSDWPGLFLYDAAIAEKAFGQMSFPNLPEDASLRYCRNREALTLFGWAPLLHDTTLAQRLHQIDIPTLVLWGEKDEIVSPSYGQSYASAIPGAKFESLERAGHYVAMESSNAFVDRVMEFVLNADKAL